jgi:hypothetical protein
MMWGLVLIAITARARGALGLFLISFFKIRDFDFENGTGV